MNSKSLLTTFRININTVILFEFVCKTRKIYVFHHHHYLFEQKAKSFPDEIQRNAIVNTRYVGIHLKGFFNKFIQIINDYF